MHLKFYQCKQCGKIIVIVRDSGLPTVCCGEAMMELFPRTEGEYDDKHVPVIKVCKDLVTVTIGSELHPSTPSHFIEWILLLTNKGVQQKLIGSGSQPVAQFMIMPDEEVLAAYDYCNIHKLWKNTKIEKVKRSDCEERKMQKSCGM